MSELIFMTFMNPYTRAVVLCAIFGLGFWLGGM